MDCARRHHAAPMGLKTVLFGLVYYKHVAPMELAVAAQRKGQPKLLDQVRNVLRLEVVDGGQLMVDS
jgi:hypothetical protein